MTGKGWDSLIQPLIDQAKVENVKVVQIKEKFGGLRFYTASGASDLLRDMIDKAERLSEQTCEYCGKPGQLRTNRSWLKTLCEECNVVRS